MENEKLDVDIKDVNFLAFQGGGGKGIAYLGPIEALERKDAGILPLKLPISRDPVTQTAGNRQGIIGISGASAGAITAYMIALGLSADDIRNESGFLKPREKPVETPPFDGFTPNIPYDFQPPEYLPGENTSGFDFNDFFVKDKPSPAYKRAIVWNGSAEKNMLIYAVDGFENVRGWKLKSKKEKVKEADEIADKLKLKRSLVQNVRKTQKRKEKKKERGVFIQPAEYTGLKNNLADEAEDIRFVLEEEQNLSKLRMKDVISLVYLFKKRSYRKSKSKILSSIAESNKRFYSHIYCALHDQGLFMGSAIRKFFIDVTNRRLPVNLGWTEEELNEVIDKHGEDWAATMTFEQFFKWTGLDLVISGVNMTSGEQHNFSKDNTPLFPVVGAVELSMNIPGLFKPIYVNAVVKKGTGADTVYKGYYVDGGLAVNLPFHAFDQREGVTLNKGVNPHVMGLRIHEGPDPELFDESDPFFQNFKEEDGRQLYKEYAERLMNHEHDPDLPVDNYSHLANSGNGVPKIRASIFGTTIFPLFGWMLGAILDGNTESQIREQGAKKRVLSIYSYHITTVDFKADDSLTEFVVRRAKEKAIEGLKLTK